MRKWIPISAVVVLALAMSFAFADHHEKDKKGGGAKAGAAAPAFSMQDQDGKTVSLADHAGKIVVLEWFNNDCPYVVRHFEKEKTSATLADKYKDKDVVWLAINTTPGKTNADNKAIKEKWSIGFPILADTDQSVGKAYGAKTTPHMFVIDKTGTLAFAGGIDNDPNGDKGADRVNYVDKALTELTSGTSVSQPQAKPYGCGVKYAK